MNPSIVIPARHAPLRASGALARLVVGALALCAMLALKLAMAIPAAQAAIPPPMVMASVDGAAETAAPCHPAKQDSRAPASNWDVSCVAACAALPAIGIDFTPGAQLRGIVADSALVDQLCGHSPEIEVPPPR